MRPPRHGCHVSDLPEDVIAQILGFLEPERAAICGAVSKQFLEASNESGLWEKFCRVAGHYGDRPDTVSSWKELYISGCEMDFNPERISSIHSLENRGMTLTRRDSSETFKGAQLKKAIPMKGRYYFEAKVEYRKYNGDHIESRENPASARWMAIGVASLKWNCEGCGWWSSNEGSGWYAAGDVYSFDAKQTINPPTINSGDVVGCMIDRDEGKQYFFKNGELQKTVVHDDRFKTLELYPTFILLHAGAITIQPRRSPPVVV